MIKNRSVLTPIIIFSVLMNSFCGRVDEHNSVSASKIQISGEQAFNPHAPQKVRKVFLDPNSELGKNLKPYPSRPNMAQNHKIEFLSTGLELYRKRLELIQSAKRSIYIASYAFNLEDDPPLLDALCQKARSFDVDIFKREKKFHRTVDVKVLLDGTYGSERMFNSSKQPGSDLELSPGAYQLRRCGVQVLSFKANPLDTPLASDGYLSSRWALHEKLLIVDGISYITGGSNWEPKYHEHEMNSTVWRDMDALVVGPSACWFHNRFIEYWHLSARAFAFQELSRGAPFVPGLSIAETHDFEEYSNAKKQLPLWYTGYLERYLARFPAAREKNPDGTSMVNMNLSEDKEIDLVMGRYPRNRYLANLELLRSCSYSEAQETAQALGGSDSVAPLYTSPNWENGYDDRLLKAHLAAIDGAERSIQIWAPYFVPHPVLAQALIQARNRGVKVSILTNSMTSNDEKRSANRIFSAMLIWGRELLKVGVDIYLWKGPSTLHRKGGVFDGAIAYMGSDNFDIRAHRYESEAVFYTDSSSLLNTLQQNWVEDIAHAELLLERGIPTLRRRHGVTSTDDIVAKLFYNYF